MRRLGLSLAASAVLLGVAPAAAQSVENVVYIQKNLLNVADIQQGASQNSARVQQIGTNNFVWIRQTGEKNSAEVRQIGVVNRAGVRQTGGGYNDSWIEQVGVDSYASVEQAGRVNRSVVTQGGETSYVTTYQNGPVNIVQVSQREQVHGRLSRR